MRKERDMAFKCEKCGQEHEGLPTDIGFARPGDFIAVPQKDRGRRCKFTDDIGVIDGKRYYIRGVLYVPVRDTGGEFGWGLWARVSQEDYERYRSMWTVDGSKEPPFIGHLSVEDKAGYEGLAGHEVSIQLRTASERPSFHLPVSAHRLSREQHEGITLHQVEEMLNELLPGQLG
jgi:hypothetical protein